jgi:hypothetical protein
LVGLPFVAVAVDPADTGGDRVTALTAGIEPASGLEVDVVDGTVTLTGWAVGIDGTVTLTGWAVGVGGAVTLTGGTVTETDGAPTETDVGATGADTDTPGSPAPQA